MLHIACLTGLQLASQAVLVSYPTFLSSYLLVRLANQAIMIQAPFVQACTRRVDKNIGLCHLVQSSPPCERLKQCSAWPNPPCEAVLPIICPAQLSMEHAKVPLGLDCHAADACQYSAQHGPLHMCIGGRPTR
jgi:hypothetical protein